VVQAGFNISDLSIIIIGAGIAGLSTGCYSQMNGFNSKIFEMHTKPGGVTTSWKRKSYVFDYSMHNLIGTTENIGINQIWKELGALKENEFINHDVHLRVEDQKGNYLNIYSDLDKLEMHLKEISPEDTRIIEDFINGARKLGKVDLFSLGMGGLRRKLSLIPNLSTLRKWSKITLAEYASMFKNPFLREALKHIAYDLNPNYIPMFFLMSSFAGLDRGDLGWPKGGSLEFSKKIAKRYLELGGEIQFEALVEKIIVRGNKAIGIRLADGSEHFADIVISAADGYYTIYKMLEGRYKNKLIESYYEAVRSLDEQELGLEIHFGLKRDLSGEPHFIVLLLDKPMKFDVNERWTLFLELFDHNKGLSPAGKSVMKADTLGNYPYWKNLRNDLEKYREQKQKVCEMVLLKLEERFPQIKEQIEVTDVTTPVTVERYTNNLRGWEPGQHPTDSEKVAKNGLSIILPGLERFYMVGQWAAAMVGLNTVSLMGRNLVKQICKEEGKKFITSIPK
jgi:phytoene dehydrogenase-like protein